MSSHDQILKSVSKQILVLKNFNFDVSSEALFKLCSEHTNVRQIRQGVAEGTKGTAIVVYNSEADALAAYDRLKGRQFEGRFLVVQFYEPTKQQIADLLQEQVGNGRHPSSHEDGDCRMDVRS